MLLGCNIWQSKNNLYAHVCSFFNLYDYSFAFPALFFFKYFLLSKHLHFTYLNFTVTVTVTIHAVVAVEAASLLPSF